MAGPREQVVGIHRHQRQRIPCTNYVLESITMLCEVCHVMPPQNDDPTCTGVCQTKERLTLLSGTRNTRDKQSANAFRAHMTKQLQHSRQTFDERNSRW